MVDLYAARTYLNAQRETGLQVPVQVYSKDLGWAELHENIEIDTTFTTPWEPGGGGIRLVSFGNSNEVALWNEVKWR